MAVAWFSVKRSVFAAFSEAFVLNRIPSVTPFTRHSFTCFWLLLPLQDLDDQVDTVTGLDQSLLDLLFGQFFIQKRTVFSRSQLKLEIYMVVNDRFQA